MKPFEITETEGEKTTWIYPEIDGDYEPVHGEPEAGRVAVKIRYWQPKEKEALLNRMVNRGVMKRKSRGRIERFDVVPHRRSERDAMFAEAVVVDLRGVLQAGQPVPYSAEMMAQVMGGRQDLYDAVFQAVEDVSLFFGVNGHAS